MLDFELTKLDNAPSEIRAGSQVTVDTVSGSVKLEDVVEIATLSAEQLSSVSSSAPSFKTSSLLAGTVRTVRRDKDVVTSVTIRITPEQQKQAATRQSQHQQPRRSGFFIGIRFVQSIDFFSSHRLSNLHFQHPQPSPPQSHRRSRPSTRTSSGAALRNRTSTRSPLTPISGKLSGARRRGGRSSECCLLPIVLLLRLPLPSTARGRT